MKRLIVILIILVLLFAGCSKGGFEIQPVTENSEPALCQGFSPYYNSVAVWDGYIYYNRLSEKEEEPHSCIMRILKSADSFNEAQFVLKNAQLVKQSGQFIIADISSGDNKKTAVLDLSQNGRQVFSTAGTDSFALVDGTLFYTHGYTLNARNLTSGESKQIYEGSIDFIKAEDSRVYFGADTALWQVTNDHACKKLLDGAFSPFYITAIDDILYFYRPINSGYTLNKLEPDKGESTIISDITSPIIISHQQSTLYAVYNTAADMASFLKTSDTANISPQLVDKDFNAYSLLDSALFAYSDNEGLTINIYNRQFVLDNYLRYGAAFGLDQQSLAVQQTEGANSVISVIDLESDSVHTIAP